MLVFSDYYIRYSLSYVQEFSKESNKTCDWISKMVWPSVDLLLFKSRTRLRMFLIMVGEYRSQNTYIRVSHHAYAKPHSSVSSVVDLRTGGRWFDSPALPIFFSRIDDSHCNRIHSSLTTVSCFDIGYVGKQQVAWKEYCAKCWLKELQESMDRCTDCRDITEILLKTVFNTIQ